jgi:DNA-binding MarR family transcriptional regulator
MRQNPLKIFEKLRNLRALQRKRLPFLETLEDLDIVREIGFYQERGHPITLKLLFQQGIGSSATIQRRLQRLKRLGLIVQKRSRQDKRTLELTVSPEVRAAYGMKERVLLQSD